LREDGDEAEVYPAKASGGCDEKSLDVPRTTGHQNVAVFEGVRHF